MTTGTVVALRRYPVKSMLGEELDSCDVTLSGLIGDRGYALIDGETGRVASAKRPSRWGSLLSCSAAYVDEPDPRQPLPPVKITLADGTTLRSDQASADSTLSGYLGRSVSLASRPPPAAQFEEAWPDIEGLAPHQFIESTRVETDDEGRAVSAIGLAAASPPGTFFDLSPLHLMTSETLAELGRLAPDSTFDVRRYRPNVVIQTDGTGFVENDWPGQTVAFESGVRSPVALATMRCVMTTLEQAGLAGSEPLPRDVKTLQAIAAHNRIDIPNLGTWACAGVYAGVSAAGRLSLGEAVTVD